MDEEEQENELLAMHSILDVGIFKTEGKSGHIKAHPQLPETKIYVKPAEQASSCGTSELNVHEVMFLPPITLKFAFPCNYPSIEKPQFTLSCVWLSHNQIIYLTQALNEIWERERGSVILYEWYQFLTEETFSCLKLNNVLMIGEETNTNSTQKSNAKDVFSKTSERISNILMMLLLYNKKKDEEVFENTVFACNVCFEDKHGSKCMRFKGCNHVYCKVCLTSYFEVLIKEGNVKSLSCPEEECSSQALPNQVQQLVDTESYSRYERLLLQTTLDTMTDLIYCPLQHCQSPVIIDQDETLAQCPSCTYAFCIYCKLVYHGVTPCRATSGEIKKLCAEYKNASSERRTEMEKRYGRKALQSALDESETQQWLETNSKPCPNCTAKIEKIDGCNKMTCYKCRAYFCWLCIRLLDKENPYKHYNQAGNKCFNRLFEGVEIDEDDFFF